LRNGEEGELEFTVVEGDVIFDEDRKLVKVGDQKGFTLPKTLEMIVFGKITGVRFKGIRNRDGLLSFLVTPIVEVEVTRE
jgi:hypothetical protein